MRTKILILMLLVAIFVQAIGIYISYNGIDSLSNYSENIINNFGINIYKDSEAAIVDQSTQYMLKIAQLQASKANEIFDEVSVDLKEVSESLKEIINDRERFVGKDLPLPEMTTKGSLDNRALAEGKIYAVDMNNISLEKNLILPYDPSWYLAKNYYSNFYRTDVNSYDNFSNEERNRLEEKNIIVSNNRVPEDLRNEMRIISNLDYIIKPIYENSKFIDSIYLGSDNNVCYEYSVYNDKTKYIPSQRNWYIDAKKNKENTAVWQDVYVDVNNRQCITCSLPYRSSVSNMSGVIGCDILLDTIRNNIIGSNFDKVKYTFMLDKKGNIVFSDGSLDSFNIEGEGLSDSCKELIHDMETLSQGIKRVENNGIIYYASYAPISSLNWSLCTLIGENEILSPISNAKTQVENEVKDSRSFIDRIFNRVAWLEVAAFILIVIFVIIISIKVSKAITKPLAVLSNGAERIGKGDISYKINVDSKDEIGALAKDFNKMTDDMAMYIEKLKETTATQERAKSELRVAKTIQTSMLPNKFPPFPQRNDIEIYAIMEPARLVGGDFYDFFFIDANRLAIVIADVSGKGVPASLFMVMAKLLIKTQLKSGQEPGEVLSIVNNQLCEDNNAGMFVTAFIGILEVNTGIFKYSNAGHNLPLIKQNGRFNFIKVDPGFVLAGIKDFKYKTNTLTIKKGDIIYFYTDGVTEAVNAAEELFSEERLIKTLNSFDTQNMKIENIIKEVKERVDQFSLGVDQADDITMLILRRPIDM